MSAIAIRPARPEDADEAALVLRRSIAELCFADHRNDPTSLDPWLANKTPEHFRDWLDNPDNSILVAVDTAGAIAAVGGYTLAGEVILNYVSPDFRFTGVSTAMLVSMETRLKEAGIKSAHLTSSATAHRFYLARGYTGTGQKRPHRSNSDSWLMSKTLA